jgi:hypothetical protein
VIVPFDQQKNAVIPVADAPHGDLQVIQGTQAACPANAGGIQKYFPKNKCLFRYSRSFFNIIPKTINDKITFISARNCVSAHLCVLQQENLRRAA